MKRTYPNNQARKVAEIIEERGWCQFVFVNIWGNVCLIAAVNRADLTDAEQNRLLIDLQRQAGGSIGQWGKTCGLSAATRSWTTDVRL